MMTPKLKTIHGSCCKHFHVGATFFFNHRITANNVSNVLMDDRKVSSDRKTIDPT